MFTSLETTYYFNIIVLLIYLYCTQWDEVSQFITMSCINLTHMLLNFVLFLLTFCIYHSGIKNHLQTHEVVYFNDSRRARKFKCITLCVQRHLVRREWTKFHQNLSCLRTTNNTMIKPLDRLLNYLGTENYLFYN